MLKKIKEALINLDIGPVKYGRIIGNPEEWNYTVFGRDRMSRAGTSRCDFNRYYRIVIVHEDFIPEDYEIKVIKALNEIPGLKLANDDVQYDYVLKNANTVVEMAVITFTEILKGYTV